MNSLNLSNNRMDAAAIEAALLIIYNYFQTTTPTKAQAINLSGATMGALTAQGLIYKNWIIADGISHGYTHVITTN